MQEIMPPKEVSCYLHISPLTVYTYARQGAIAGSRIGNSVRFNKEYSDTVLFALTGGLEKKSAAGNQ
jgi:excisionase family DNA binding protein